jgi:hypothetical protein
LNERNEMKIHSQDKNRRIIPKDATDYRTHKIRIRHPRRLIFGGGGATGFWLLLRRRRAVALLIGRSAAAASIGYHCSTSVFAC